MEEKSRKPFLDMDFFENLTGEIPAESPKGVEDVGQRIRKIREEKGLTLEELSRLTGFDVQFLSSLEKNEAQPQLGTVINLPKALSRALDNLITRKNERRTISRSTSKTGQKQVYTYKSLAPEVKGRHMEALIVQLEVDPDKEISVHDGEEFIFVLDGIVVLEIGDEKFELEPGDSVYYLSTTPHHIAAKDDKSTILAVLYEG